jgi:hypothetical protein
MFNDDLMDINNSNLYKSLELCEIVYINVIINYLIKIICFMVQLY